MTERFAEWCVFEQLGRNWYPAHVTVETIAGQEAYRLDVPGQEKPTYIGSGTMYAIHPRSEEVVRRIAAQWPTPCHSWELPKWEPSEAEPADLRDAIESAVERATGDDLPGDDGGEDDAEEPPF